MFPWRIDPRTAASWRCMIKRCTDENHKRFADYGGRGISVVERWMDLGNFLMDMGNAPAKHTLERRNNDLGYSPENCYWATPEQQARNRRNTVHVEIDGEKIPLWKVLEDAGLTPGTREHSRAWDRLRQGYPLSVALKSGLLRFDKTESRVTNFQIILRWLNF